ncbi:MAG: hypothetical protein QOE19_2877, partial [Actinomycetota bacterium]|nr:hypothetical protein [Actinomycetota bacterium]
MTTAPDQQLKRMKLRYAGTCRTCATPLPAGTLAIYDRASRLVTCLACLPVLAGPASAVAEPSGPPPVSPPAHATPREDCRRLDGDWVDLAANVPGQAVRALAEAELAAMRQRSRLGTVIARAFDVKTDERAWRVGADGEETVGARLDKLSKRGWHVLHSVPVGTRSSDIDHVVIGPGGVWTVNTKRHPSKSIWVGRATVLVDGHRQPYLRNSRHEAERASRLLTEACGFPVPVKAALVFLTGTLIPDVTIKQAPDGVAILDRTDIPRAFRRT